MLLVNIEPGVSFDCSGNLIINIEKVQPDIDIRTYVERCKDIDPRFLAELTHGYISLANLSIDCLLYTYNAWENGVVKPVVPKTNSKKAISNNDKSGCVYLIKSTSGHIKIGTSKDPEGRLNQLRKNETLGPFELSLHYYCFSKDSIDLERHLHGVFSRERVHGEWFLLNEDQIAQAISICCERGRIEFGGVLCRTFS